MLKKKCIAMIVAVLMVFTCIPAMAYAEDSCGHEWCFEEWKGSCTDGIIKVYSCYFCEATKEEQGEPREHYWGEWTLETDPTCESDGEERRYCENSGCSTFESKVVEGGHEWCRDIDDPKKDCKQVLYLDYTCNNCGEKKTEKLPATEHKWSSWTIDKAFFKGDWWGPGEMYRECTNEMCDKYEYVYIYSPKKVNLSVSSYTYNGKAKTPTVTVYDEKYKVISPVHYTVTYSKGRTNVGTYQVTVKFKPASAYYTGYMKTSFKVNPAKPTKVKLTKGKKQFKVSWKKPGKSYRNQIDGYQIRYATSKSKLTKAKPKYCKGKTAVNKTFKKLKSKRTYYVQVRAYNKIGSKTYYSGWTTAKSVKTR